MFDCVLPTRTARTGSALTAVGRLNLRNARFARDPRPLEEGCGCPACVRFTRAYVRHLVDQHELLGLRLLSLHNLWFVLTLTAGARTAIERGDFEAYRAEALARLAAAPENERKVASLILIVAMFALLWVLLIRPQRQRTANQQRLIESIGRRRRDADHRGHLRDIVESRRGRRRRRDRRGIRCTCRGAPIAAVFRPRTRRRGRG